jgi:uncharacterized protein
MPAGLLDRVRFQELAERGAQLSARIALAACPRLAALVAPEPAEITASLVVSEHSTGVPIVRGEVDAELAMSCQRCLDSIPVRVHAPMKLAIVSDGTQPIPEDFEPFISRDGIGRLADLVEEEILLSLPEYPVHASLKDCGEVAARLLQQEQAPQEPHGFELLRNFKIRRNESSE